MAARNQNFDFYAGDSKIVRITVTDENGDPVPLDTITAADWRLSREPGGPALISKAHGSGVTVTNPAGGVVQVVLQPADTAGREGFYAHELVITDDVNQVTHTTTGTGHGRPAIRASA